MDSAIWCPYPAIWCFHRASEKGHAGAAIAYGSLLLRGVQVPESLTKLNDLGVSPPKRSRKKPENIEMNPLEMAKEQFQVAARAGCDLGLKWLQRVEQEEIFHMSEEDKECAYV